VPPSDTGDDDNVDLAHSRTQDLDPLEDAGPPLAEVPFPKGGAVYDPAKDRETTRSKLALRVVWLLVGVVALLMGSVISELNTWEEVEGMASSVLPAVLTVVGTVLGFYFGSEKVR
jgi:hypothetical protein